MFWHFGFFLSEIYFFIIILFVFVQQKKAGSLAVIALNK